MRINKTVNNLELIWNQLDNASSELHNLLDNIARMANLPEEIKVDAERIDVSQIDSLRNEIEELIIQKKEELKNGI